MTARNPEPTPSGPGERSNGDRVNYGEEINEDDRIAKLEKQQKVSFYPKQLLQKKSKKNKNKDDTLELKELSDSRSKFDKKTGFTGGSSNNNHLINRSLDQLDNDPI